MTNMSYCAFENTANDMKQAMEKLVDVLDGREAGMSEHEQAGLRRMVDLALRMAAAVAEAATENTRMTAHQYELMSALAFNYTASYAPTIFGETIKHAVARGELLEAEYEAELEAARDLGA